MSIRTNDDYPSGCFSQSFSFPAYADFGNNQQTIFPSPTPNLVVILLTVWTATLFCDQICASFHAHFLPRVKNSLAFFSPFSFEECRFFPPTYQSMRNKNLRTRLKSALFCSWSNTHFKIVEK